MQDRPEPTWVRDDVALAIHNEQLAEHGGPSGVRSEAVLSAALASPKNHFHYGDSNADLADFAAMYAHSICARNHPFVDGNKRTAVVVCELFLNLNGYEMIYSAQDGYDTFLALADETLGVEELAVWIRTIWSSSSPA